MRGKCSSECVKIFFFFIVIFYNFFGVHCYGIFRGQVTMYHACDGKFIHTEFSVSFSRTFECNLEIMSLL